MRPLSLGSLLVMLFSGPIDPFVSDVCHSPVVEVVVCKPPFVRFVIGGCLCEIEKGLWIGCLVIVGVF